MKRTAPLINSFNSMKELEEAANDWLFIAAPEEMGQFGKETVAIFYS